MTDGMERAVKADARKLAEQIYDACFQTPEYPNAKKRRYLGVELLSGEIAKRFTAAQPLMGVQRPEEDYNRTQRPDGTWASNDPNSRTPEEEVSHPADDIKLELHQFLTENVADLDDVDALVDDLDTIMIPTNSDVAGEFVRRLQKWLAST